MINPELLKAFSKRWNEPQFAGGKYYIPVLVGNGQVYRARRTFKRASEALTYAKSLLAVWRRVYPLFQRLVAEHVELVTTEN